MARSRVLLAPPKNYRLFCSPPTFVKKMGCRRVCAHLLLLLACWCVGAQGALPDAVPSDAALYGRDCSNCTNGQSGESRRQRRKERSRPSACLSSGGEGGRVNCAVLCAFVYVLRCCVLVSRGVTLSLYAPVDGTSGVLVHLHLALSLPGLCAVRAVERCCLFPIQWRLANR